MCSCSVYMTCILGILLCLPTLIFLRQRLSVKLKFANLARLDGLWAPRFCPSLPQHWNGRPPLLGLAFYVGTRNSELHFCMLAWLTSYRQKPLPCLPGFSIYMCVCITGFLISIFPKNQCYKKDFRMISMKEFTKSIPSKYLWPVIIYVIQLHNVCIFNCMCSFFSCAK